MQEWEPFWLFELRSTVNRALIGRKRMVAIGCGMLTLGVALLLLTISPFGLVGSYNYATAVLGVGAPVRSAALVHSNPSTNMALREEKKGTKGKGKQKKEASSSTTTTGQGKKSSGTVRSLSHSWQEDMKQAEMEEAANPTPRRQRQTKVLPRESPDEEPNTFAVPSTMDADLNEGSGASDDGRPAHSKRTSNKFNKPQHICPGRPSTARPGRGAPPGKAIEDIKMHLRMIADGYMYNPDHPNPEAVQLNASCVFVTKPCSDSLNKTLGRWIAGKLKITTEEELNEFAENLPDIEEGGLGSCAIVGNSDNMLKSARGADIDAHDTIFRHNTPTRGYDKYVGKRSTIIYMKSKYQKSKYAEQRGDSLPPAELAYAELKDIAEVPRSMKIEGKHIFLRGAGANFFARERRKLYRLAGVEGRRHPSGGFARPINLLASKLCTRIDLYGFSGGMGGKYFAKNEKVSQAHAMAYEHWAYRYLMSEGRLCIYGD